MSTIARVGNLKIQVYADDHFPWHCHIVSPDFEMLVDLDDLSIIKGARYRRQVQDALDWVEANLELARAEWKRLNER